MTEKTVGRFLITVELDRVEGGLKYYDVVLSKDGMEVKIHKGCIGPGAFTYWEVSMIKTAKKLELLHTRRDMVAHNLLCYSTTYLMDTAKPEYEKEWQEANEELTFIDEWVKSIVEGRLV